mmetsp:Transcript_28020/g.78553  ORF Transcript_28020/g.78553 Transcript_28020/m.78553 type:complete len:232 (-) Transcript_28020:411-1106(-)
MVRHVGLTNGQVMEWNGIERWNPSCSFCSRLVHFGRCVEEHDGRRGARELALLFVFDRLLRMISLEGLGFKERLAEGGELLREVFLHFEVVAVPVRDIVVVVIIIVMMVVVMIPFVVMVHVLIVFDVIVRVVVRVDLLVVTGSGRAVEVVAPEHGWIGHLHGPLGMLVVLGRLLQGSSLFQHAVALFDILDEVGRWASEVVASASKAIRRLDGEFGVHVIDGKLLELGHFL